MTRILFDMDGVLADWERAFGVLTKGATPEQLIKKGKFETAKQMLPKVAFYAHLDPMPLVEVLKKYPGKWGILTSVGKYDTEEVINQKKFWLMNVFGYEIADMLFVITSSAKAAYAEPGTLLIDDRKKALIPFAQAGGQILQYKGTDSQNQFIEELLKAA